MTEKNLREYYGPNYFRFLIKSREIRNSMKTDFLKKYPGADMSRFEFSSTLGRKLELVGKQIYFKVDDNSSYDIESDTFKNNGKWTWYLYQWKRIWSVHGTVQDFKYTTNPLPYTLNKFRIYVTDSSFFTSNFPEFNTSWNDRANTGKNVDISRLKFDYVNNPYFTAILAMYLITYKCGISMEHLKGGPDTPRL